MTDPERLRGTDTPLGSLLEQIAKPTALPSATDARVASSLSALGNHTHGNIFTRDWRVPALTGSVGGALLLGYVAWTVAEPPATPISSVRPAAAPTAAVPSSVHTSVSPLAPPLSPPAPRLAARPAPLPAPAPSSAEPKSQRSRTASGHETNADTLAAEAAMLHRAHSALAVSPRAALDAVEDHARRFPNGQLRAERELIRVQALLKVGRRREAEARARTFKSNSTSQLYTDRIDAIMRQQ